MFKDLAYDIVGAALAVYHKLGPGFLEAVYRRALMIELRKRGLPADEEQRVPVHYEGHEIGDYKVDILVDGKIVLELKACKAVVEDHVAQALNYLAATRLRLAIIMNFGPRELVYRRVVR